MKVVRKPDYSNWQWRFCCSECTAELEACSTDVEAQIRESCWCWYVTCPICRTRRQIPNNDVPRGLQFELKDRVEKQNLSRQA